MADLQVAHFSDNHLGYERYGARDDKGRNQRGTDVVKAFLTATSQISELDVPLVINSGDVFDAPHLDDNNYGYVARLGFQQLTQPGADGRRRQCIVIAGNHDAPRRRNEPCVLDFWRGMPGLHVVTNKYTQIRFNPHVDGCHDDLRDVVVHCIPHDTLRDRDTLNQVTPVDGHLNILVTHGVAEGSELFERSIGREFHIPASLLGLPWDYVALGHWHVQGPVKLGQFGTGDEPSRIWYAGSTEITSWGDAKDARTDHRGYLVANVTGGQIPDVDRHQFPTRVMLRLPRIDATDLTPEQVTESLIANLSTVERDGAVITQAVEGVTREKWGLVDMVAVRAASTGTLAYECVPRYHRNGPTDTDGNDSSGQTGWGQLEELLVARAEELVNDQYRSDVVGYARKLLADVLESDTPDSETTEAVEDPAA